LKSIQALFWRAMMFQMLPNQGGITIRENVVSEDAIRLAIERVHNSSG
jgi:hypothetical protein